MLYYWYRIARILVSAYVRRRVEVRAEETALSCRVRLLDCDGLRVMTASKYPVYMDFVRWAWAARTRQLGVWIHEGLAPALGAQKVVYGRPLKRWSRFVVRLRILGWDDRWFYNLHLFEQGGEVMAVGVTKAVLWRRGQPMPMKEFLRRMNAQKLEMEPPLWVRQMFEADRENLHRGDALE